MSSKPPIRRRTGGNETEIAKRRLRRDEIVLGKQGFVRQRTDSSSKGYPGMSREVRAGSSTTPVRYSIAASASASYVYLDGGVAGGSEWLVSHPFPGVKREVYALGTTRTTLREKVGSVFLSDLALSDGETSNVTAVAAPKLAPICTPKIRREGYAGFFADLDDTADVERLYAQNHWPALFQMCQGLMGWVKLPAAAPTVRYFPVLLTPVRIHRQSDGELYVTFAVSRVSASSGALAFTPMNVVSGDYATDYAATTFVAGASPVTYTTAVADVDEYVAMCRLADIPKHLRSHRYRTGFDPFAPIYAPPYIKQLTFERATIGTQQSVTFFDVTVPLTVPPAEDGNAILSMVAGGFSIRYIFDGTYTTEDDVVYFTGDANVLSVTPVQQTYYTAGFGYYLPTDFLTFRDLPFSGAVTDLAGPGIVPHAFPGQAVVTSGYALDIPLDFVVVGLGRTILSTDVWERPLLSSMFRRQSTFFGAAFYYERLDNWTVDGRPNQDQIIAYSIAGAGYNGPFAYQKASQQTLSLAWIGPRPGDGAPVGFSETTQSIPSQRYEEFILALEDGEIVRKDVVSAALQPVSSSALVDGSGTQTSYAAPANFRYNGVTYAYVTSSVAVAPYNTVGPSSWSASFGTPVSAASGVSSLSDSPGPPPVPFAVTPDIGLSQSVSVPDSAGSVVDYPAFFYLNGAALFSGMVPASEDMIQFQYPAGIPFYTGYSYGYDGAGPVGPGYSSGYAAPTVTPAAGTPSFSYDAGFLAPDLVSAAGIPEYPVGAMGTTTGGLYVVAYMRNAIGTATGFCVIRRAFTTDIFMLAYFGMLSPERTGFDRTYVYGLLTWFETYALDPNPVGVPPDDPTLRYDPSVTASFPGMVAAVTAAKTYYNGVTAEAPFVWATFREKILDVARAGRTVVANNFASDELLDFVTTHNQTLVIYPKA